MPLTLHLSSAAPCDTENAISANPNEIAETCRFIASLPVQPRFTRRSLWKLSVCPSLGDRPHERWGGIRTAALAVPSRAQSLPTERPGLRRPARQAGREYFRAAAWR